MNELKGKILVILLIVIVILTGCAEESSVTFPEERNSFWIRDIEFVQKLLPSAHANFYANITEEEFNSQMEKLKNDIPHINDDEIKIRLMEIFAPVGDAHLFIVNFYSDMQKNFSLDTFLNVGISNNTKSMIPIKTKWFGDSLYVTEIDSEYQEALGTKLVKINNASIEEVVNNINSMIPHNNEQRLKFLNPMHLTHPQILRHYNIIKKDSGVFSFEGEDGKTFKLRIKEKDIEDVDFVSVLDSIEEKPLYMEKDNLYWYKCLPEKNTLYFRLSTYGSTLIPDEVSYEEGSKTHIYEPIESFTQFPEFTQELISQLEEKEIDKFIIDLRGNNGGYYDLTNDLFYKIQLNSKINQKGKLFVIADKGSFSAPILECMRFRDETNAIIVGEPTGEMPFMRHGANANTLTLPSSKLSILYAVGEFRPINNKIDSLTPDYLVEQTFEDYRNGIDTVLEAIFNYPEQ